MREAYEETGLRIDPAQLDDQNVVTIRTGSRQVFYYLYLLDDTEGDDEAYAAMRSKPSREVRDVRWFDLDGIPESPHRIHETRALFSQITRLLRRNCHDDVIRDHIQVKFASTTATATADIADATSPHGHLVGAGSTGYNNNKEKQSSKTTSVVVTAAVAVNCPDCGKW